MAFGAITTLYLPTAANAGSSQWGTDVRKLLDSADAGSDATTKTNHGTGGSVVRTCDPYTTTTADLDQSLYGWAVAPSDMNSVAGARRRLAAGNHVATLRVGHTAATAKNANIAMYVYRVSSAAGGRARTLLGTANSGTLSIPGTAGEATFTITVALGEIILEPDETLQYSFEVGAAGTAVSGDIITMFTGTQSAVVGKIVIPTLNTLTETTGSAAGSGSVSGSGASVDPTTGTVAGTADATGTGASVKPTSGAPAGTADAQGSGGATAQGTGDAGATSSAAGEGAATATGTGTADGAATVEAIGEGIQVAGGDGAAAGTALVDGQAGSVGGTTGTADGAAQVDGQGGATAGGTGEAGGSAAVAGIGKEAHPAAPFVVTITEVARSATVTDRSRSSNVAEKASRTITIREAP